MSAQVTDNLPLLAGAPNGIKKLRELILELAVRGKLVPQDPNDEPASELLKRIAEEKARLVDEGKIKKQKPLAEVLDDEKPFELPAGWVWTRIGDICLTQTGTTPNKGQPELFGSDVPFIKPGDIYPDQVDYSGEGLSSLGASQSGRIAQAGSLLMVCIGTIGKCNLIDRDCSFNQQINSATLYKGNPQYLRVAARSSYFQAKAWGDSSSTTIAILNKGKWEAILIPLPNIAEQHRIVAKVDELMALCDRLEAKQADAESAHAQLVQALLDSLTQAVDADDFAQSWQRLAEHFHTLFTTESSIDALKQTLLQLAVMGKLVPQDPNDEPASELLKRIAEEKARLVAEGKIKKQKPLAPISEDEKPFELPASWLWGRLSELTLKITDGTHHSPTNTTSGEYKYISAKNIKSWGIDLTEVTYVTNEIHQEIFSRCDPSKGDILYIKDGATTGIATINSLDEPFSMLSSVALLKPSAGLHNEYMLKAMVSPLFYRVMRAGMTGVAITRVTLAKLNNAVIPLPPLAEQHRIVAKVDQLMALCDQLKQRLSQARTLHEQLANTLVEQAVA